MIEKKATTMSQDTALQLLANGHAVYTPDVARKILEALDVGKETIYYFEHDGKPPTHPKGLYAKVGRYVTAIDLGRLVAKRFMCEFGEFFGRGTQGAEIAMVIKTKLDEDQAGG